MEGIASPDGGAFVGARGTRVIQHAARIDIATANARTAEQGHSRKNMCIMAIIVNVRYINSMSFMPIRSVGLAMTYYGTN